MKKRSIKYLVAALGVCLLSNCTTHLPKEAKNVAEEVVTYPDVKGVTIPQGIAPLNFIIGNASDQSIVEVSNGNGGSIVQKANSDNEVIFDVKEWKKLLKEAKEGKLECTTYLKKGGSWEKLNPFHINVIDEPIDSFVTYRLIEPSFMSTGQIGLFQFDLTTGEETTIMRRCQNFTTEKMHEQSCVNCHSAQKKNPKNKMFYYRGKDGGLFLTYNGKISKIETKVPGMFKGTTYPAWHPTLPYIVFSENDVHQDFPTMMKGKVEFFDREVDLVLYDIEKNETYVINETRQLETNPTWSPDGEYVYFALTDSVMRKDRYPEYEYPKLKYDIARIKFDPETKSFSKPEIVLDMSKDGRSATFPRISPDNKFLLVVISNFGASPHSHKEADLYVMNLETKELTKCDEANSNEAESYHDFSSQANWFVFYSRREDGNYGRAYISHLDSTGKCSKPFQLPHKDPQTDIKRLKVYNMIEFANAKVAFKESDFYDVLWNQAIVQAGSDPRNRQDVDGTTGATKKNDGQGGTDGTTGATKKNDGQRGLDGNTGASVKKEGNDKFSGGTATHGE
ncbi:MAG: PD40 domain-containing protein [Paludibacteraceae bacterium]|nr:PD40 domain-containing protein [Paludibacteraceae bacterium]